MNERRGILVLLACIVVLATAAVLMLPAISATKSDLENAGVADVSNTVVQAESEDAASDGADAAEEAAPEPEPAPEQAPEPEPEPAPATVSEPEQTPATTDADQPAAGETPDATTTPEAGEVAAPETVDPETAAAMPAQNFYDSLKKKDQDGNEYVDLAVYIEAPAGALPAGSTMKLDRVKAEDIQGSIDKAVKDAKGEKATATIANAVNITFTDADGNLVEPAKKVNLKISASEVPTIDKPVLARVTDEEVEGKAELQQVAKLLKKAQLVNWEDTDKSKGNENTLQAQLKKFGAFAILKVEGAEDEKAAAAEGEGEGEPEAAPDAATMPAQNFYETIKSIDTDGNERIDIAVYVDAPEGAFPEGTTMKIARVQDADVKAEVEQAVKDAKGENSTVKRMTAVDIVFLNAEGNEIEPATKVDVKISASDVPQMADPMLVHVVDKEKPNQAEKKADAEVLQQVDVVNWDDADKSKGNENALRFAADEFSPYVIVEVETITADVITASGEAYKITVSYTEDAGIPEGAELKVNEILADTDEYKGYLDESAAQLGLENADGIEFARFFDIQIMKGEEKVEPKTPVQVKIEYADKMDLADGKELAVVHFADQGTEVIEGAQVNDDATEITYEQGSFSVTGTIVTEPPQGQERKYMVLVNYPTNSGDYYIVNNDGTLTKVNYNASARTVDVEDPMLWTIDGSNPNRHIYFNTEATGFNYQDTAADYFRRYIDPNSDSGITEETEDNITLGRRMGDNVKTGYVVTNRNSMLNQAAVNTYNDNGVEKVYHGAWNDNLSLGVELDGEGNPTRIKGKTNWGEAANVVFAEARSVPGVGTANHTVDHIDISISGKSQIDVPLAYGTYYYGDPNNPDSMQAYTVTTDTTVTLEKDNVSITPEDMKRATIKAYNQQGEEVDDAFVIDGYSSNASNAYSTVQVRIGGRFKVADLPSGGGNDATTRANRLANKLTYEVSAVKELTFPIADEAHGQLYELKPDGSYEPISITVDVNMAASFDYWDERNECPGIKNEIIGGSHDQWVNGGIPDHGLSGMDFVLGGDADAANNKIVALEITKLIVDENGQLIQPAKQIVNSFDVYQSKTADPHEGIKDLNVEGYNGPASSGVYLDYSKLHSKDVIVGSSGMGLVFDYAVTDGMYYITEKYDDESLPKEIVDVDGKKWEYEGTYITTEYERRGYADYDDKSLHPNPMHYSKTYTTSDPYENGAGSPEYASTPEVLGTYVRLDNVTKKNGFLEFFVHNVYTRGTKLEVEKQWQPEGHAPNGAEVTVELQYRMRQTGTTSGSEVQPLPTPGEWTDFARAKDQRGEGKIFDANLNTTLTLKASSTASHNWKGAFTGLPKTYIDAAGNVYELDYSAEETAVKVPAPGKTVVDEDAIDVTDRYKATINKADATGADAEHSDGTVTIINTQGGLVLEKKWLKQDGSEYAEPPDSDAEITAQLRRKRTVAGAETTVTEKLAAVTIQAKDTYPNGPFNDGNPVVLWQGNVVEGSDLWFSVAANGTSNPSEGYSTNNGATVEGPDGTKTQEITYLKPLSSEQSGIKKQNANVFVLKNVADGTVVTANFGAKQESNGTTSHPVKTDGSPTAGFGYYIVEKNDQPESTVITGDPSIEDEAVNITGKVTNGEVKLNKANGWSFTLTADQMDPGWEYYFEDGSIQETTGDDGYGYSGPTVTTDENGNKVYTCANTEKPGALKLTKTVKVDGQDPTNDNSLLTNGAYKFTVTGNGVRKLVEVAFENGVATYKVDGAVVEGANGSVVLNGLTPGDYVITETDSGALTLTGIEGGKDDGNVENKSVTVTVTPGDTAADQTTAQAAFTNNIETTSVTVTKAWSDTVNHDADVVTFTLYQRAIANADNEEEMVVVHEGEYEGAYTNQITGSGTVTIPNLPKSGVYTDASGSMPVTYDYYVVESTGKAGYIQVISRDASSEDYNFTITNVPPNDNNKDTSVSVTKEWEDENGDDASAAHAGDEIVFKLIQTKKTSGYVPVTVRLFDANGGEHDPVTYYVQKGGSFTFTADKMGAQFIIFPIRHGVDISTDRGPSDHDAWSTADSGSRDFEFRNINDALTISARLTYNVLSPDVWGDGSEAESARIWGHSVSGTNLKNTEVEVVEAAKSGQVVGDPTEYSFTMHKNDLEGGAEDFTKSATDWVGTVGKLPLLWKIDNDFYAYYYEVTEVSVNGEQVQYSGEPQDGIATGSTSLFDVTVNKNTNTITNKEKPKQFKLNILKVDNTGQGDPVPLPNAKFELQKVKDDEVASSDGEPREFDTNAQGQITMDDLVYGYYRVTEKNPPAGYVLSENPVFYIKVSKADGVQLLVKGEGKPSTWAVSTTGQQGDVISFVADPDTPNTIVSSTATVKNEPGKPLPNTGGIGTEMFTIFGIMLVVIAGAVILLGRNRPYLSVPSIAHMRETIGGRR